MRHSMLVPLQLLTREQHPPVQESRAGDMYYNIRLDMVFVFDGTKWDGLKGAGSEEVVIQPMDPSTDLIAANNNAELWVDTDDPGGAAGGGGTGAYLPLTGGTLIGPLIITPTDPLQTALNITTGGVNIEAGGVIASNFTPTLDTHLTTKEYVDAQVAAGGGGGGGGGVDEIIISSTEPVDPALEMWIDLAGSGGFDQTTADALYVNINGDTMTGPLTVGGPLTLAADPVGLMEAATKNYVDLNIGGGGGMDQAAADARYVNVTGDTLTGPITMGVNNVIFNNGNDQVRLGLLQSFPVQVGYPTFKVELYDDSTSNGLVSMGVRSDGVAVPEPTLLTDATTLGYVNTNFARVTVSPLAPPSPNTGDIWIFHTP